MKIGNVIDTSQTDVVMEVPAALTRVVAQKLTDLSPWQIMPNELAMKRLHGLRQRYSRQYVPFARRIDCDDLACIEPDRPSGVVVVHDFATEGSEVRRRFDSFWDWFREAIEEMIAFES